MPDKRTDTSPAATTGGRACAHWRDGTGRCGNTGGVRMYVTGPRCPTCTPAALAGRPEPAEGHCPPARCWCGGCPSWRPYNAYNTLADSWITDARAIASGKRRAGPELQAAAKQTVAEQKEREARIRKGAA